MLYEQKHLQGKRFDKICLSQDIEELWRP